MVKLKTIINLIEKSYSHKPHLADLPYDRRSTDKSELEERIKEIDKRIEKEIEEQERRKKSIKNWEKSYEEYQQEIKKEEENIKTKTKDKEHLLNLVDDNAKELKSDIDTFEKGLYYEKGKKLSQKELEEKWSTPTEFVNNSIESLKLFQKEFDNLKREYNHLENNLNDFHNFQGKSESNRLSSNFDAIGEIGLKIDDEIDKVSMGRHTHFMGELTKLNRPFNDYGSERYRINNINKLNTEIYKHNKSKENYAHLSESIEHDINKYSKLLNESEKRLQDYKEVWL